MESPEANVVLSESQEADVGHLVDIFGEQQPIDILRQHVIQHRNDRNRINIITNEIFSQNDANNESTTSSADDKFALIVDMFPNIAFDRIQRSLDDFNGDLQKVVDQLSIPINHSPPDTPIKSTNDEQSSKKRHLPDSSLIDQKCPKIIHSTSDQSASGSGCQIDQSDSTQKDQSSSDSVTMEESESGSSQTALDSGQSSHTLSTTDQSASDMPITHPESAVAPKPHNPEEIADRVRALMEHFPDANPAALFHRMEECQNVDQMEQELITELSPPVVSPNPEDMPGPSYRDVPSPNRASPVTKLGEFLSQEERDGLIAIVQMFPDVDPNHVFEQIAQQQKGTEAIVEEMTGNPGYPKMKQRREKEKVERRRQEFLDGDRFKMEEYLRIFNDPETYFIDQERNVSQLYIQHAKVYLMNTFPKMKEEFLSQQLELHGNHLLPTIRTIEEGSTRGRGSRGRGRGGTRRKTRNFNMPQYLANGRDRKEPEQWPKGIDEQFFRELQFIQHQDEIKELKERKETEREEKIANARENGLLEECQCCFSDECLNEEMISCQNDQHKFCKECVQQHAQTQVAEGQHKIGCMAGDCKDYFSFRIIQSLLRPNEMNLILRRWQQDELRNAQLDNMESCPSCDFAMIIENNDERVFRCQNPDCLKETCRECQEPSHIPLRCNEVEKDAETQMRTFIENKMAEAMIRICPKCNNRLIKSDGCNKLKCPCGAAICYVCREQLVKHDPYSHFRGQGRVRVLPGGAVDHSVARTGCPLQTTMDQVHADVAETAGRDAREEYLRDHPELREMKDIEVNNLVERNRGQRPRAAVVYGGLGGAAGMRVDINFGHDMEADRLRQALMEEVNARHRRIELLEREAENAARRRERGDICLRQEIERQAEQERLRELRVHARQLAERRAREHARQLAERREQEQKRMAWENSEERNRLIRQEMEMLRAARGQQQVQNTSNQYGFNRMPHMTSNQWYGEGWRGTGRQPSEDQQPAAMKNVTEQPLQLDAVHEFVQGEMQQIRDHDYLKIDETVNEVVKRETDSDSKRASGSIFGIFDAQPPTTTAQGTTVTPADSTSTVQPLIGIFDVQPTYVEPPPAPAQVTTSSSTDSSVSGVLNPDVAVKIEGNSIENQETPSANNQHGNRLPFQRYNTLLQHQKLLDNAINRLQRQLDLREGQPGTSSQKLLARLKRVQASRFQVENEIEGLIAENPELANMVEDKEADSNETEKKSDHPQNDHQERVKQAAKLRKQYQELDVELKAAQRALPKAKGKEGKAAMKKIMTLLRLRDEALHQCQELEAQLLKDGVTEGNIGRQDTNQFHLTNDEIHGAAQEATTLAAEAQAIRNEEINQVNAGSTAPVLPEITVTPMDMDDQQPNMQQTWQAPPAPWLQLPATQIQPMQYFTPIPPPTNFPIRPPLPPFVSQPLTYPATPIFNPRPSLPHVSGNFREPLRPENQLEYTLEQARQMMTTIPTAPVTAPTNPVVDIGQIPNHWCQRAEQLLLQAEDRGFSHQRLWEVIQFMRETFVSHEGATHEIVPNESFTQLGNFWRDFVTHLSAHIYPNNQHNQDPQNTGGPTQFPAAAGTIRSRRLSVKQKAFEQRRVMREHKRVSFSSCSHSLPVRKSHRTIGKEPKNEPELSNQVRQVEMDQEQQVAAEQQAPQVQVPVEQQVPQEQQPLQQQAPQEQEESLMVALAAMTLPYSVPSPPPRRREVMRARKSLPCLKSHKSQSIYLHSHLARKTVPAPQRKKKPEPSTSASPLKKTQPEIIEKNPPSQDIDTYNKEYREVVKKLHTFEGEGHEADKDEERKKRKKERKDHHKKAKLKKLTIEKKKLDEAIQKQVIEKQLTALEATVDEAERGFNDVMLEHTNEREALQQRRHNAQAEIADLSIQIELLTKRVTKAKNNLKDVDRSIVEMTRRNNDAVDRKRVEMENLRVKLARLRHKAKDQTAKKPSTSSSSTDDSDQPSTSGTATQPVRHIAEPESEHLLQMIRKGKSMGLQDVIVKNIEEMIESQGTNKSDDVTIIKVKKPGKPPLIVLSDDEDDDPSDSPEIIYEHRMPQSTVQLIDDSAHIDRNQMQIENPMPIPVITRTPLSSSSHSVSSEQREQETFTDSYDSATVQPVAHPELKRSQPQQSEPAQKIMRRRQSFDSTASLPLTPERSFGLFEAQNIQEQRSLSEDVSYSGRNYLPSPWSSPATPATPTRVDNGPLSGSNFNAENVKSERTLNVTYGEPNRAREAAGGIHQPGVIQINIHLPQQMPEAHQAEQVHDLAAETGVQNEANRHTPVENMDVEEAI